MGKFLYDFKLIAGSLCLLFSLLISSCAIENDIPYPIVKADITAFRVEGQRAESESGISEAIIDVKEKTISVFVNDSVDLKRLKILELKTSAEAELILDSTLCDNYAKFPRFGFASLDSIPVSSNTRVDFRNPVNLTLRTYQDYLWKITVKQIIDRTIEAEGLEDVVIDENQKLVILYVSKEQPLNNIQISTLNLGGSYGVVNPDPTTIHDFSNGPVRFFVHYPWDEENHYSEWKVYAEHNNNENQQGNLSVNAWAKYAYIESKISDASGTYTVEYTEASSENWKSTPAQLEGKVAKAKIAGLKPTTAYKCRLKDAGGQIKGEASFTTESATALYNGSFDDWYKSGKTWYAVAESDFVKGSFWDSSNPGTTTGLGAVVNVNPTQGNSSVVHTAGGKSAELKSQAAGLAGIVKFAAASLYSGSFQELVGTSGAKIQFGQPFSSRPTKLKGWYQYSPGKVDYVGNNLPANSGIEKGKDDICTIYIALAKKQYTVNNTDVSTFIQFDKDPNILAYGELPKEECVSTGGQWKEFAIDLKYRSMDKITGNFYIILVASASKYGDYFTGSSQSIMYLDDFELIYD